MLNGLKIFTGTLAQLPDNKKLLINTLNAHSYNVSHNDPLFYQSLKGCDVLIPDGIGVVLVNRLIMGVKTKKIAGYDLFEYEMDRLNNTGGTCFFLGSSETVLKKIKERAAVDYPEVRIQTFSPPFKDSFSGKENDEMIRAVNTFHPDVLFIGMTAPKQEKWAYEHLDKLNAMHIGCIGAVFDFYAGTVKRAPHWMIWAGLEWFYRLIRQPKKMWRRYIIGNILFLKNIYKLKHRKPEENR